MKTSLSIPTASINTTTKFSTFHKIANNADLNCQFKLKERSKLFRCALWYCIYTVYSTTSSKTKNSHEYLLLDEPWTSKWRYWVTSICVSFISPRNDKKITCEDIYGFKLFTTILFQYVYSKLKIFPTLNDFNDRNFCEHILISV